jgi:hypothetical protein
LYIISREVFAEWPPEVVEYGQLYLKKEKVEKLTV